MEASCFFPSLTLWNPEKGGKNNQKRWFKRKEEKTKMTVQIHLIWKCDNVFFLHHPWATIHYFQIKAKFFKRNITCACSNGTELALLIHSTELDYLRGDKSQHVCAEYEFI